MIVSLTPRLFGPLNGIQCVGKCPSLHGVGERVHERVGEGIWYVSRGLRPLFSRDGKRGNCIFNLSLGSREGVGVGRFLFLRNVGTLPRMESFRGSPCVSGPETLDHHPTDDGTPRVLEILTIVRTERIRGKGKGSLG